jgi:hypothetical protein
VRGTSIAETLKEDLAREIKAYVDEPVFFDTERLKGGQFIHDTLALALCESVCMIMLYTPSYFHETQTFCTREYFGMKALEAERLALAPSHDRGSGLIIPIIVRGARFFPKTIRQERRAYDFQDYFLGAAPPKKSAYRRDLDEIASYIRERHQMLRRLPARPRPCEEFRLPAHSEILTYIPSLLSTPDVMPRV